MLSWSAGVGVGAGEGPQPGYHDSAPRRQPAPGLGVCGGKRHLEPETESSLGQLGECESEGSTGWMQQRVWPLWPYPTWAEM